MRWTDEEAYLCIAHFSESQWASEDYSINTGWGGGRDWELILNSQAADFGGWGESCTSKVTADENGKILVSLPKWCCAIFKSRNAGAVQ